MRLTPLLLLLLLVGLSSCQEGNRRARLRSLISKARQGDAEAKNTLRSLRLKLKERRNQAKKPEPEIVKPLPEPTTFHPPSTKPTTTTTTTPEPPITTSPTVGRIRTNFQRFRPVEKETPTPIFESRRPQTRKQVTSFANTGLEVGTRTEVAPASRKPQRNRVAPVETIRRYSYFDDAGNYVFGYESADGSFKEEVRGKDCVVHGKYGYIDPDGVKREYSYVSGNRCDPNALPDQEVVEPLPLNDQFLQQTQERQLTDAEFNALQGQRRRQPAPERTVVPHTRRIQAPRRKPQRVQQQRIPTKRFPPFPGTVSQVEEKPFEPVAVETPALISPPTTTTTTIRPPPPPPSPFQSSVGNVPVFSSDPSIITFDFDREFKGLFDNFPRRRVVSQPRLQPVPRPVPAPRPPVSQTFPTLDVSNIRSPHPGEPHQLVYDAATRTFKTVPLNSLVSLTPQQNGNLPSLTPFKPNPLPKVPLSGLTIGPSRNAMTAKEFDNFFNNIELIVQQE